MDRQTDMIVPQSARGPAFVLQMNTIFSFSHFVLIVGLIFVPVRHLEGLASTLPTPITFLLWKDKRIRKLSIYHKISKNTPKKSAPPSHQP